MTTLDLTSPDTGASELFGAPGSGVPQDSSAAEILRQTELHVAHNYHPLEVVVATASGATVTLELPLDPATGR